MKALRTFLIVCIILGAVPITGAYAQETNCQLKRPPFVNGGASTGTMTLEQGSVCRFKFRFGEINPPDTWEIVEAPKSGKVVFKDDVAEYTPNDGFSGDDKFVVALFGKAPNCGSRCNRNGRFEFSVTVKPKS